MENYFYILNNETLLAVLMDSDSKLIHIIRIIRILIFSKCFKLNATVSFLETLYVQYSPKYFKRIKFHKKELS